MATDKAFQDFVARQQAAKAQASSRIDPAKELEFWLRSLEELYARIETYLQEYISSGGIEVTYKAIELNEEFCGTYQARQMNLSIGPQQVTLTPIGTMLIGSRGRVDVLGPAGRAMIALMNKKATSARSMVHVSVRLASEPAPPSQIEPQEAIGWEWKLVSAPPERKFTTLTQEVFLDLILEVANG
jgi:hypothetical protein